MVACAYCRRPKRIIVKKSGFIQDLDSTADRYPAESSRMSKAEEDTMKIAESTVWPDLTPPTGPQPPFFTGRGAFRSTNLPAPSALPPPRILFESESPGITSPATMHSPFVAGRGTFRSTSLPEPSVLPPPRTVLADENTQDRGPASLKTTFQAAQAATRISRTSFSVSV